MKQAIEHLEGRRYDLLDYIQAGIERRNRFLSVSFKKVEGERLKNLYREYVELTQAIRLLEKHDESQSDIL